MHTLLGTEETKSELLRNFTCGTMDRGSFLWSCLLAIHENSIYQGVSVFDVRKVFDLLLLFKRLNMEQCGTTRSKGKEMLY